MYDRVIDCTLGLDACLSGLGGKYNWVYHLHIQCCNCELTIVHLEMVNVLLAMRVFTDQWNGYKVHLNVITKR